MRCGRGLLAQGRTLRTGEDSIAAIAEIAASGRSVAFGQNGGQSRRMDPRLGAGDRAIIDPKDRGLLRLRRVEKLGVRVHAGLRPDRRNIDGHTGTLEEEAAEGRVKRRRQYCRIRIIPIEGEPPASAADQIIGGLFETHRDCPRNRPAS